MTRTVYIIGGAGTGKSTFTGQLMDQAVVAETGPLEDLHARRNAKALVTLRGHRVRSYQSLEGLYLGVLRESFPGTDGLDRASSLTGEEWLQLGGHKQFEFILAEGSTLATRRFLYALHEHTDLLVIHLSADEFVKELRFLERGSNQDPKFVKATATRALNLLTELQKNGVETLDVDSADPLRWSFALDLAHTFLLTP